MRITYFSIILITILLSGCNSVQIIERDSSSSNQKYIELSNYPIARTSSSISATSISFRKIPDNRLAAYMHVRFDNGYLGGFKAPYEKPQIMIKTTKNGISEEKIVPGYVFNPIDVLVNKIAKENPNRFKHTDLSLYKMASPLQAEDIWGLSPSRYSLTSGAQAYVFEMPISTFAKIASADKIEIVVQTGGTPFVFELEKDGEERILEQFRKKL
ncbi:MAG: hypothetical protein K2W94_08660 [Alphaproteobacteria bacterium]|nr:hypothetical protein [Alphaproteobacteria bacterium]